MVLPEKHDALSNTRLAKSKALFRRAAPWLLFGIWLAASAAHLWAMEIEALRAGFICSTPSQSDSRLPPWIQELLR